MRSIRSIMTRDPLTISRETSVIEAARLMREHDIGSIPVVDDGRLVGIVTDRDIVVRAVARGMIDQPAGEVMSREPVTLGPDEDDERAEQLMKRYEVHRLPVCDDGTLVGIVSIGDLAVEVDALASGEVLRETGPVHA